MKLLWKIVERDAFLEGGPYLLGKEPWAVDFYLWMLTNWLGEMREEILKECPKIANMHKLIRENPIVVKVHDLHYPPSGK